MTQTIMTMEGSRQRAFLESLSTTAVILGRKFSARVHVGGEQCCTDGKDVWLPAVGPDVEEDEVLGLLLHECGHLRFTDFTVWQRRFGCQALREIFNALEDVRIEQAMSRVYAGGDMLFNASMVRVKDDIRRSFEQDAQDVWKVLTLYAYLFWTQREHPAIGMPELLDAARASVARRLGSAFMDKVDAWFNRRAMPDSSTGVFDFSRAFLAVIKRWLDAKLPEPDPQQKMPQDGSGSPQGDGNDKRSSGDSDNASENSQDSPQAQASGKARSQGNASGDKEQRYPGSNREARALSTQLAQSSRDDMSSAAGNGLQVGLRDRLTASAKSEKRRELQAGEQPFNSDAPKGPKAQVKSAPEAGFEPVAGLGAGEIPQPGFTPVDPWAWKRGMNLLDQGRRDSTALRRSLLALVQDQSQRGERVAERGRRLCPRTLARVPVGDPRLYCDHRPKQDASAALQLVLDCSGSMQGAVIELASRYAVGLLCALRALPHVSAGLSVFPAVTSTDPGVAVPLAHGPLGPHCTALGSIKASGGTPLARALSIAHRLLWAAKETRKIALVITDGMPDSLPEALQQITAMRNCGFLVTGILVGDDPGSDSAQRLFGRDGLSCPSFAELPQVLSTLTRSLLARR